MFNNYNSWIVNFIVAIFFLVMRFVIPLFQDEAIGELQVTLGADDVGAFSDYVRFCL